MAEIYKDGQFGVVDVEEIAEGLRTKELALEKTRFESEKKELPWQDQSESKEIRQNYRKAVSEGRRSRSGKIVCDNWEKLKSILGRITFYGLHWEFGQFSKHGWRARPFQ